MLLHLVDGDFALADRTDLELVGSAGLGEAKPGVVLDNFDVVIVVVVIVDGGGGRRRGCLGSLLVCDLLLARLLARLLNVEAFVLGEIDLLDDDKVVPVDRCAGESCIVLGRGASGRDASA